jgi:hypothetical protein
VCVWWWWGGVCGVGGVGGGGVCVSDEANRRRGSEFLKAWMAQLEEQADLRYPDLAEVWEGA